MASINRVDQAILLLKDRLRRLQERTAGALAKGAGHAERAGRADPMVPLRQLVRQGGIGERDLRRALVRTLLADALGDELAGSLEFQSIAERVADVLEDSEVGRQLVARALTELG